MPLIFILNILNKISAPASAHPRPSAQAPINTSGNFSPHMFGRGGSNKFENFQAILSTFLFFPRKNPKTSTPGAPHFFYPKSYFSCDLKPHAKFQNPTITPSGRKVTRRKEREKRNKPNA